MRNFHIAAYTYRAEEVCPECISKWASGKLREQGFTEIEIKQFATEHSVVDVGIRAFRSENLLRNLAEILDIDLEDYYSFDSDNFPKIIFYDQIEEVSYCPKCKSRLD